MRVIGLLLQMEKSDPMKKQPPQYQPHSGKTG
jgi:hypothetical protein